MKKLNVLALIAVMALSLTACKEEPANEAPASEASVVEEVSEASAEEEVPNMASMANPLTEVGSLQELNDQFMICMTKPAVMGVTDEKFFSIDAGDYKIAEYLFTVNGLEYCYRAASTMDDISGIYVSNDTLYGTNSDEGMVDMDGYKGYRWFTLDGQYMITVHDDGALETETFQAIGEELKSSTLALYGGANTGDVDGASEDFEALAQIFDPLSGNYQDSVSGRASMTLTSYSTGADVVISWGDSASTTYEWRMSLSYVGEQFVYDNCEKWCVTSDGTTSNEELLSMGGTGYFEWGENGTLAWTGAEEDNCKECIFEKLPE